MMDDGCGVPTNAVIIGVKMAVISGVGTRHYYRRLGYELEGPYMVKALQPVSQDDWAY